MSTAPSTVLTSTGQTITFDESHTNEQRWEITARFEKTLRKQGASNASARRLVTYFSMVVIWFATVALCAAIGPLSPATAVLAAIPLVYAGFITVRELRKNREDSVRFAAADDLLIRTFELNAAPQVVGGEA